MGRHVLACRVLKSLFFASLKCTQKYSAGIFLSCKHSTSLVFCWDMNQKRRNFEIHILKLSKACLFKSQNVMRP